MISEDSEYDRLYNTICSIVAILKDEGINIQTKFEKDSGYVGLYTSNTTILKRAKISLKELLELSYSTAEHHPYWNIIYNTSEIAKTTLDNWDENISHDQIKEMLWRNEEIKNILNRLEKEYQL
ncbi:MAG TPA: hypothetical protein VFK40_08510 [Nitrososphaeraceae archaeon]|jgi:hypothetical protein|nr:hypothetical protein [Nitrososphaeraceae archaeon]